MNKLSSFATLVSAALIGIATETAWSDETTPNGSDQAAVQTPAPATAVAPGWYPPPNQGGYAQTWQQPPHWPAPQQAYGQLPPRYPASGQYQSFPAAPAAAPAAWKNPLSAELKQTQEQLTAQSSELDQLRGKLQDSLAAETILSDKTEYCTREQQTLRVRVTELTKTLDTSNATLEQQHQLINNHQAHNQNLTAERDQLHSELASRDEQLAALQSELQAATQSLAQARSRASTAGEALSAARVQVGMYRDELTKLEAELERQETHLQGNPQSERSE
jgi:Skp family chaperone for outer membrane proteins